MSEAMTPRAGWGRRPAAVAGAGAAGVVGLSLAGAAVAGLDALVRARPRAEGLQAEIVAVDVSPVPGCSWRVTLRGPGSDEPGIVALGTAHGRLVAGPATVTEAGVERDVAPLAGVRALVLRVGEAVEVHGDPWHGCADPFALGATTSTVATPDGPLAVTCAGPSDATRAVVYLHGRGGQRHTGWWFAPTAIEQGWRVVMPAYRNDPDEGPATGRYLLGGEWVDLAAVLDRLAADGVEQVVLVGWSMGGNICASYLRRRHRDPAPYAHHPVPVGLVLDAPALDWGQVLRRVAAARRLPRRVASLVMAYGQLAARIDWRDLDHLADPEHLDLPVLTFHGTDDDVVPVEVSQALAHDLPHVRLELVEGGRHCRSVNVDPGRYLAAFGGFLAAV
jgi:pimeloyl-ACP methyl ester carboxylesterase